MPLERLTPTTCALASIFGLGLIGYNVYHLLTRPKADAKGQKVLNDVLFFPDSEYPCKRACSGAGISGGQQCFNTSCTKLHGREGERPSSMIKFLKYLGAAEYSVDLCIFMFTQQTLANLLLELHKRYVRIRIITDTSEDDAGYASQLERLQRAGIEVKSNRPGTGALMHHKFVLVDGKVLLSGSFNWTNKAIVSNYEAVTVTSVKDLVAPFVEKFEELWSEFPDHSQRKFNKF